MKAGGPNLYFSEVVQAFLRTFREIGRPDLSLWYSEFGYTTYLYGGQREKGKYTFAAYTEEAPGCLSGAALSVLLHPA